MGSCAAPSAKGDDKFITTDYLQQCPIYMQAALDHLRAQGETLNDEDIARLSPLCHGHINMLGHYSFTLAELVTKGHLRPLKEASEAENVA
ncbi:transposase [Escherichia coli]|nr:hypothetical protein [Klebsiella pneumoniae]NHV82626.1 transposase [Escherichia coli]